MIRFGIEADRQEIMELWGESFGDAQEEIAEIFRCLAGEGLSYRYRHYNQRRRIRQGEEASAQDF